MSRAFNLLVIIPCLLFFPLSYSFGQDTQKEKPKKEVKTDDADDDVVMPEEENMQADQVQGRHTRVGLGVESGIAFDALDMGGTRTNINIGGTLGAYADISLSEKFYLQPGVFYLKNGGGNAIVPGISPLGYDLNIYTIEVPVIITYKTGEPWSRVRFAVGVGGYYGYNAAGDLNGAHLHIGSDAASDDIKAMDAGAALNIGLELWNGVFFYIKSQRSLTNLQPDPHNKQIYTESGAVTVGYLFGRKDRRHKPMHNGSDKYIERSM